MASAEDKRRGLLTREIVSFRKVGDLYRRSTETHVLRLSDPAKLAAQLRSLGFRVRTLAGYGQARFPPGQVGLLARKPAR